MPIVTAISVSITILIVVLFTFPPELPAYIGTLPEWIAALGTIGAIILAFVTLRLWSRQENEKRKSVAAEKTLLTTYALADAIVSARNTFNHPAQPEDVFIERSIRRAKHLSAAMEATAGPYNALRSSRSLASIHFGSAAEDEICALCEMRTTMMSAFSLVVDPDGLDIVGEQIFLNDLATLGFHNSGNLPTIAAVDDFEKEVWASVKRLDDLLRPLATFGHGPPL